MCYYVFYDLETSWILTIRVFIASFLNSLFSPIIAMSDECPLDVVPHPTDGWRVKAKGKRVKCKAKLDELLENLGPHGQNYLKRRWDFVEE